jgi:hypothetical protein
MKPYADICDYPPEKFKRETGLSKENIQVLFVKVDEFLEQEKARYPMNKRGKQSSSVSQKDRVLLTLYYLRHYPTFTHLGDVFSISESYCCKIYHKYARILAQVEKLPNRKVLLDKPVETIIVDATEQPIERPLRQQKAYYSGKKNDIQSKHNLSFVPSH